MVLKHRKTTSKVQQQADHNDHEEVKIDMSTQEQALLKALEGFIVMVDARSQRQDDQRTFGPAAVELITMLKQFISIIVGNAASEVGTTVEVNIDKQQASHEEIDVGDHGRSILHEDALHSNQEGLIISTLSPNSWNEGTIRDCSENNEMVNETGHFTFHDKFLRALREYVFNKVPIRLLHFEPQASNLQISLVGRGAICAYLESIAAAKMHEKEYGPIFDHEQHRLETDDEAIQRLISTHAGYAILSHTWIRESPGEVTYNDWKNGLFSPNDAGYLKLVNFCKVVWRDHGLKFGWMDTVCIDKESSSELDESIRSMYNWYERAQVCIIYLAESETILNMHMDSWFTRGWTLQELLAPHIIKFYNRHWKQFQEYINDKGFFPPEIPDEIEKATTISWIELHDIHEVPFSRRMQMAAIREVTREEDIAYSLMGIFGVSIATAYGEGANRAFYRLLQEILTSTSGGVLDIFNWADYLSSNISYILPASPRCYINRSSSIALDDIRPLEPLTLTHMGLRIPVLLMPGIPIASKDSPFHLIGEYTAFVHILPTGNSEWIPTTYRLLDKRASSSDDYRHRAWPQYTFAVINIQQGTAGVFIPQMCIAIALECYEDVGKVTSMGTFYRIETTEPVVFDIENNEGRKVGENGIGIEIPADSLCEHGMQLISMYL